MVSTNAVANSDQDADAPLGLLTSIPVMLETIIIVLILLLFSEALLGPLLSDETQSEDPIILRLMWLPVYGIIFGLAVMRALSLVNLAIRMPIVLLLLGLIAASTLWSIDPEQTFRRAIAISMTTAFGLFLAARYTWRDLLAILGIVWLILGIGSFIVSLGVPALGVESVEHVGAWKGLWFQKNSLGGHMARASLLFGFLAITQPRYRRVWLFGVLMAILLVLLSTSKTSLLGMGLGFIVLGFGLSVHRGPIFGLVMFWSLVTFGSIFVFVLATAPEFLLGLIGRDATLTGRTDIWMPLLEVINERPDKGYGYGAFWGEDSDPANYVREITQWSVPTAHNGWLEIWLGIGRWGLMLFTISFMLMTLRSIRTAFSSWNGFYAFGFLLQFFLFSLSESNILQQNAITWVSYVAVTASLVQQNLGHKPIRLLGPRRNRDFILTN